MKLLEPGMKQKLKVCSVFPNLEDIKQNEKIYFEFKKELESYLIQTDEAVGISLPQFGENIAVFSFKMGNQIETVFSPKIISTNNKIYRLTESCMSFPNIGVIVDRPSSIEVSYLIFEKNKWKSIRTKLIDVINPPRRKIWARIFQHEFDHLNGTTMLDSAIELAPTTKRKVIKISSDFYGYDYYIEEQNILIFENKKINTEDYPNFKIIGIYEP